MVVDILTTVIIPAIERSKRVSLEEQRVSNIYDMGMAILKHFKERFLERVIGAEVLEKEIPASENRVDSLFFEVIFRL